MAATDMRKAGLEMGARVDLPGGRSGFIIAVPLADGLPEDARRYKVEISKLNTVARYYGDEITRDYDEAQSVRHTRFDVLSDKFPGDAGVPENTDTIERYVCVQKDGTGFHAYTWGDDFEEVLQYVGGEILDGWMPLAVYDLDTGGKHDLHISSPVVTVSEDSPSTVNELNATEAAEAEKYVEANYDLIGWTITASVAVENKPGAVLPGQIREFILGMAGYNGVENVSTSAEEIRQLRPAEAKS